MKAYCKDCDCITIFDDTWDHDCFRCHECGCLPYGRLYPTDEDEKKIDEDEKKIDEDEKKILEECRDD